MTFNVTTIGDQACILLPPDALTELGVKPGDKVDLQRACATDAISETERQVEIAKQVMIKRRDVLKRLAE